MKIFEKLSSFQYKRPDFHYLSKAEAEAIAAKFENEDGTTGAHWSFDTMRNAVEGLGVKMCDEPFFNGWALWVVMNMLHADHAKSVDEFVPKEEQVKLYYAMAVEKLMDKDRAHFVRKYFDIAK